MRWFSNIEKLTQLCTTFVFCEKVSLAFIIKKFAGQVDAKTEQFLEIVKMHQTGKRAVMGDM